MSVVHPNPFPVPDPEGTFQRFREFVDRFHPIELLSQLTLTFLFTQQQQFIGEASAVRRWARFIEFTAGYSATQPLKTQYERFHGGLIDDFERLINEYFVAVSLQLVQEGQQPNQSRAASDLLASAKIHSLYVRGDAYPHQFLQFASELYGEHDAWFRGNLGFAIGDAIRITRAIEFELERRVNDSADSARSRAPQLVQESLASGEAEGLTFDDLRTRIACHLHFGNAKSLLSFTAEQLASASQVDPVICKAFLKRMSQPFGYRNPMFPNTYQDARTAPWDYNCVDEKPFLKIDDEYWLFTYSMLPSVLFYTFYFDVMGDRSYRDTFSASRGTYLERKVKEYVSRLFPARSVLLNPTYPNGEEFSDVAVLYDGKILIFQCKAKGFTRVARIGHDFAHMRSDFQAAVRAAFDQAVRSRKYIRDSPRQAILKTATAELHIDTSAITDIYLINVTLMPLHAFTSRFENIEAALGLFPEREYPLSMSLGDLDIVTHILDSPARFLHYVNRRLSIEKTGFDVQADEIDLLNFYLTQGMQFTSEEFVDINSLALAGFSDKIDEYVHRTFDEGEQGVEKPYAALPAGFAKLIADIESLASMYRTDCAIALLDLGGSSRAKAIELFECTKAATRSDGNQHSSSMGMSGVSRGLSFVSFGHDNSPDAPFKAAFSFAALKKYAEKTDEWFGFSWRLGSPRYVDAAVMLRAGWQYDNVMDAAVKQFLKPGQRTELS